MGDEHLQQAIVKMNTGGSRVLIRWDSGWASWNRGPISREAFGFPGLVRRKTTGCSDSTFDEDMDFPCSNSLCLQVALDACALRPQSLQTVGPLLDALQSTRADLLYSLAKPSNSGVEKRQVAVAVILNSLKNHILGGDSCMGL